MIKGRIQEFLIHPAFISFVLWVVVILFIPPLFSKYRIKHIADEYVQRNLKFIYSDLDSDGNSEKISFDLFDTAQTKIIVSREDKILDQYNLKHQPIGYDPAYIEDFNNDGFKECYVVTVSQDSIFLNIIDPAKSRKIIIRDRFIDIRNKAQNSTDIPHFKPIGMIDSHKNNSKDLIFIINSGYSLQPRNVYRYLIKEDSLIRSPESGIVITNCILCDVNNDIQPEILLEVTATGNLGEEFPFTDQYSWLMVMDDHLKFLFPPVQFPANPSRLLTVPLKQKDKTYLVIFSDYYGIEGFKSAFYLYDISGNKLAEKPMEGFESIYSHLFINDHTDMQTFYFLRNRDAVIDELDCTFQIVNTMAIQGVDTGEPLAVIDADGDGKKEYIFRGRGDRSIVIAQSDFRNSVSYEYERYLTSYLIITQIVRNDKKPLLYLQSPDLGIYIQYYWNPVYYLKYPFYGALYITILVIVILLSRIQQYRLNQKQETEKKIASLQMKAIKNQIDPHFTFNIINAIGSLYTSEKNREKADYVFGKYARLIRQTVISSDKIIVPLEEELDFVKNYIELEQFRSDYSFDYTIDIAEEADRQIKIPRMLIHTFVENAIKYGIRNRSGGGFLKVAVVKMDNKCEIIIEDNGPGLKSGKKSDSGTGKGLTILNGLIELFHKLEKTRISYTIQNIPDHGNRIAGTMAKIEVTNSKD